MNYYIIFGPPGVGKGTQSKLLSERHKLKHISTGDLLRREIAKGSETGKAAKEVIEQGRLVDDEIIFAMIRNEISNPESFKGVIFDGFPRNIEQAVALESILEEVAGGKLDAVISLEADDDVLRERILKRATIEGRKDDASREVVSDRIETYHAKTKPLINHYKEKGKYYPINGENSIEEAFEDINRILEKLSLQ